MLSTRSRTKFARLCCVAVTCAHTGPTGELAPVEGTPFDLREATPIGRHLREGHPQLLRAHNLTPDQVVLAVVRDPTGGVFGLFQKG